MTPVEATRLVKGLEHMAQNRLTEQDPFGLGKEGMRGTKIAVCDSVLGRHRVGKARILEIVNRLKRNRHKHEHGEFQLFYCELGQILGKVTQTGCNLFSHGNILESTGRVPK